MKTPHVVSFAYKEFKVDNEKGKWSATCRYCSKSIMETRGTTSGFARYVLSYAIAILNY